MSILRLRKRILLRKIIVKRNIKIERYADERGAVD